MINYWKGAQGSKDLLNTFNVEINNILTSNYAPADLEKLQHPSKHTIYSYRLNQADRLLFTTVSGFLYVLEFVPNHDYQKSRFLKSGVLRDYLNKHVEDNEPLFGALSDENDKPEFLPQPNESALITGFDHYNQQFISLSETQSLYVETSHLPLVLHGAAGSGKTYMGFSMLQEKLQSPTDSDEPPRCLYITKEKPLASSMQMNWENSFLPGFDEKDGTVEFKTYEELLSDNGLTNLVSETNFNEWFQTFKSNDDLPFVTASDYYQELRICAALTKDEYESLGERQSSLARGKVRTTFYALYQQYVSGLGNKIDPALSNCLDGQQPAYDFIVVDEANRFSLLQNLTLSKLARNHAVVYCLDALQNMEEICSTRNLLEVKLRPFNVSSVTLDKTYRCSKKVSHALDKVLENNRIILGGKVDKAEALSMSVSNEVDDGEFYVFPPSQISDNPWLKERASSIHFAVVTRENNFEEARARFNTELIFTPQQIQGQEFHTVVVYKLLANDESRTLLRQSAQALSDESSSALSHRSKSKKSSPNAPWAHEIFTACARAKHTLVVIDENNLYWQRLSSVVSASSNPVTIPSSAKKDWQAMAVRQQAFDNADVATRIHEKLSLKESSNIETLADMPSVTQHYDEKLTQEFHAAIKAGNFKKFKKLIKKPEVNLKQNDSRGMHALTLACHERNTQMVKLLLEMGDRISLNAKGLYGLSPLQIAANFACIDIVKMLVAKSSRIDLNQRNREKGPTALMMSVSSGYTQIAKLIMSQTSCDLDMQDEEGHTALMFAAANNKIEIVKALVLTQCNLNIADTAGYTALMLAVRANNAEIAKILLAQGSRLFINATKAEGLNALLLAVSSENIELVKLLINTPGIDLNQRNYKNGPTPLLIAAANGHHEIVKQFIAAGCDMEVQQEAGNTALLVAAANNHASIIQLLMNAGCEINTANNDGYTAVMVAANNGHFDIVKMIARDVNCDLNKKNNEDKSALVLATDQDQLSVVEALIQHSDRIDLELACAEEHEITAFMIAAYNGNLPIVKALMAAGCDVNAPDTNGRTPLMMAISHKRNHVAQFLLTDAQNLNVNALSMEGYSALSYLLSEKPLNHSLLDLYLNNKEVIHHTLRHECHNPGEMFRVSPFLLIAMMKRREACWEVLRSPDGLYVNSEEHKVFLKAVLSSTEKEDKYKTLHDILFKPCHKAGFFTSGQNELALQIKDYVTQYCEVPLTTAP